VYYFDNEDEEWIRVAEAIVLWDEDAEGEANVGITNIAPRLVYK
jgi:hypothetical protein